MAMARVPRWRLAVTCVCAFVLVFAAVVAIRVMRGARTGASGHVSAAAPAVLSPQLIATMHDRVPLQSLAFSPDGKLIAGRAEDGIIEIRSASTGSLLATLNPPATSPGPANWPGTQTLVAFSPDGKTLAVGGLGSGTGEDPANTVELWDLVTKKITATLSVDAPVVYSIAFSPDGRTLAVGAGGFLVLWNLATRQSLSIPDDRQATGGGAAVYVGFSADGKTLGVADPSLIRLWDVTTARFTKSIVINQNAFIPAPQPRIEMISVNSDSRLVAAVGNITTYDSLGQAYSHPTIWLWHTTSGKLDTMKSGQPYPGVQNGVTAGEFSPVGQLLATGYYDGEIVLWDPATGKAAATFHAASGTEGITALVLSPDGRTLAAIQSISSNTGKGQSTIQLWNLYGTPAPEVPLDRQSPLAEPTPVFTAGSLGTSTYSGSGYYARIVTVTSRGFELLLTYDATGQADLRDPATSCIQANGPDGSYTFAPLDNTYTTDVPGHYAGTMTFPMTVPGSYTFTYSCQDDYSYVPIGTVSLATVGVSARTGTSSGSPSYEATIISSTSSDAGTTLYFAATGPPDLPDLNTSCLQPGASPAGSPGLTSTQSAGTLAHLITGTLTFTKTGPATFQYSCGNDYTTTQIP